MKKTAIIVAGFMALLTIGALATQPIQSPTDRINEGCIGGDMLYELRDGTIGWDEGVAECAHTAIQ